MNGAPVTAHRACVELAHRGATRPMTVNLIRVWCHRKKIRRVGTDASRRALYDLDDIVNHARTRGFLDNE